MRHNLTGRRTSARQRQDELQTCASLPAETWPSLKAAATAAAALAWNFASDGDDKRLPLAANQQGALICALQVGIAARRSTVGAKGQRRLQSRATSRQTSSGQHARIFLPAQPPFCLVRRRPSSSESKWEENDRSSTSRFMASQIIL